MSVKGRSSFSALSPDHHISVRVATAAHRSGEDEAMYCTDLNSNASNSLKRQ